MQQNRQNRTESDCEFRWIASHFRWTPHYICTRAFEKGWVRVFPPESALFGADTVFKGVWVVMVFGTPDTDPTRITEYKGEVAERHAFLVAVRDLGIPTLHKLR